jgi:hypothetical protein
MWNPFARQTRVLRSPLDAAACRERLRAETGSIWNPFAAFAHPVRGRITDRGFCITRSIRYRNSFQTEACGRWMAEGDGTRIELSLGMSRWVAAFMIAWLGLMLAFAAAWRWMGGPPGGSSPAPPWFVPLIPLMMIAFAVLLVAFGRWLARHDARYLLEFLDRTLQCPPDAEPIS